VACITLSFDNGPDPEATPLVLDVLRKCGLRASFFVLGDKLRDRERRAVCERAHDEGHWIGNHTFNHLVPLGLSPDPNIAKREIGRTQALLGNLSDGRRLLRPFGGGGLLDKHLLNRFSVSLRESQPDRIFGNHSLRTAALLIFAACLCTLDQRSEGTGYGQHHLAQ
jgi:peptidoglycan-N-acetylglucosamine deacetylase